MSKRKVLSKSYEVEEIVAKKVTDGKVLYQVKWKDFPSDQNTWEPVDHLENVSAMVEEFEKTYGKKAKRSEKGDKEKEREREKSNDKGKEKSKGRKKSVQASSSSSSSDSESVSHTIAVDGEARVTGIRKSPKNKDVIEMQVVVNAKTKWEKLEKVKKEYPGAMCDFLLQKIKWQN